jgi:hypothetical protein
MEKGQKANYLSFMNGKFWNCQTIMLISENEVEFIFQFETGVLMTISKNVGFDHTWYLFPNKANSRRTLIIPF